MRWLPGIPTLLLAHALVLPLLLASTLAGVESHPEIPVLKDAQAVMRVNDAAWIDRQVTQLATAFGEDPGPARDKLSRALFFCGSISAIDLQRPAMIGWRDGSDGLLAVVPIADRGVFLDTFGELPVGQSPLVRVGDQEGTVLYSRNLPGHREDYRLLISNDTGYLAHTLEECRALASQPLRLSGDDIALSYVAWGPFPNGLSAGVPVPWPDALAVMPPGVDGIVSLVHKELVPDLLAEIADWRWQVREQTSAAALELSCDLVPESPLSAWMRLQTAQPVPIPEVLPPECVFRLAAAPTWQGQCEAEGTALHDDAKAAVGAGWTPPVEEAWRAVWSSADHSGTLGLGMALPAPGQPCWLLAAEHPQADVLVTEVSTLLAGWQGKRAESADKLTCIITGGKAQAAVGGTGRQVLVATGPEGRAAALALSALDHAGAAPAPGPVGLAVARLDVSKLVRAAYASGLDADAVLPPVLLEAVVSGDRDQIRLVLGVPLSDVCAVLNKVSWK